MMEARKRVVITGANSGIGKVAAEQFAREGYAVVLACRNQGKGEQVAKAINQEFGERRATVIPVDLSDFRSIRHFCQKYMESYPSLDVLIHNAGCFNHGVKEYQRSKDGFELTFATNVFGPFLMTNLLKESLAKAENPLVIAGASTNLQHFLDAGREIDFEDLEGERVSNKPYDAYKMYGDSKMALFMIMLKISELWKEEGIRANTLMISGTKLSKESLDRFNGHWKVIATMQNMLFKPQSYMANNYYLLSEDNEFSKISGKIISGKGKTMELAPEKMNNLQIAKNLMIDHRYYPRYAEEKGIQDKLWALCEKATKSSVNE